MKYIKLFEKFIENKNYFVWIHGLPGSGKSTLSEKIKKENPDKNFIILDDISSISPLYELIRKEKNIIFSSPYFENYYTNSYYYNKLKSILEENKNYELVEFWFENDLERCVKNLKNRKEHKIDSKYIIPEMSYYSRDYIIPDGVDVLKVF
jgi:adenylate kinase family enzyme